MPTILDRARTAEEIREYFRQHPAEQEVLQLLCDGHSPKQITVKRNTSIITVRRQIDSIHKALDRHDNVSSIVRGLQLEVISLPKKED